MNDDLAFLGAAELVISRAGQSVHDLISCSILLGIVEPAIAAEQLLAASRIPEAITLMERICASWKKENEKKQIEAFISMNRVIYEGHRSKIAALQAGKSAVEAGKHVPDEIYSEGQFCQQLLGALWGPKYKDDVPKSVHIQDLLNRIVHSDEKCWGLKKSQISVHQKWKREFSAAWFKWYKSEPWKGTVMGNAQWSIEEAQTGMLLWFAEMHAPRESHEEMLRGFRHLPALPFELPEYIRKGVVQTVLTTFAPIHSALETDFKRCEGCPLSFTL